MSKRAASPSLDAPNAKRTRNQIPSLSDGDESVNQEAGYQPQSDDDEVILLDKAQVAESSSSRVNPSFPSRAQDKPALQDPAAWDILERFLTTDLTFGNMETEFHAHLGHRHDPSDWTEARQALFSGDGDDALSLSNLLAIKRKHIKVHSTPSSSSKSRPRPLRKSKNPFIDLEADDAEDEEEEEEEEELEFEPGQAKVTHLPSRKHTLSDAVARIEETINRSSSIYAQRLESLPPPRAVGFVPKRRMYVFTVNVSVRQFIADHLEKRGLELVISPWIPSHIYITSDSPRTILATIPDQYASSVKKWDVVTEDEEAEVNSLRLQFPYPAWLRIKRGKYRDAIAYLLDCEQSDNFVTALVPPRDFPYTMPKGSIALFDPSRLPTGISPTEILRNGEVIGLKYKGEEYYGGLLKKTFHRYATELVHIPHPNDIRLHIQSGWDTPYTKKTEIAFSKLSLRAGDGVRLRTPDQTGQIYTILATDHSFGGSVTLEFDLDGRKKQMKATLAEIEQVFDVGDEVRVVAGVYSGVEGHIVLKYDENFTICQSGTQEEIQVSKYYLDRRPIDRTLQGSSAAPQYVDPPEEAKSIEIGDSIRVTIGDLIGRSGLVLWVSGEFVWFHDDNDLLRDECDGEAPTLVKVNTSMVERTRLPATLKFTRERGYDIRPGDMVSVARGPEFNTKGVVTAVDLVNALLTIETEHDQELIKVPIRFVVKTRNGDLDAFNKWINKEVYIIGGEKKGFRATLYSLSNDDCIIAVHGQPHMTIKRANVATTYGCRLNGAMLQWQDFTAFCDMRRRSHIAPPARSVTPPPERTIPVDAGPSIPWASWSPEVLAAFGTQTDNAGPSNQAEDPWTVNPSDTMPTVEPAQHNPREPIGWLREFALKFHSYHALFNVSAGFQGGKLIKRLANSHCPDPFCGPNGIAPPGHIAAWCTAKTAGGTRMDYHIPVEFLTPSDPRRKNQECFVMNGDHRGLILTVAKCNLKARTVEFQLTSGSNFRFTYSFDDICVVEPSKDMQ